MKPKPWMIAAWAGILALLVAIAVTSGGKGCAVPQRGPFHWLLEGHKFVPAHSRWNPGCMKVK